VNSENVGVTAPLKTGMLDRIEPAERPFRRVIVHPRMAWIMFYEDTGNVPLLCRMFGISRKTFYKWWTRYRSSGCRPESLLDVSRKPHHSPNATPEAVVHLIQNAREETGFGPRRLRAYLKENHDLRLSEHTIWKVLKRSSGVVGSCQYKS